MPQWAVEVRNFEVQHNIPSDVLKHKVQDTLEWYHFPSEIVKGEIFKPNPTLYSHTMVRRRHESLSPQNSSLQDSIDRPLYFLHNKMKHEFSNPYIDERLLLSEYIYRHTSSPVRHIITSLLPQYLRRHHRIIVYQTRFAHTGGTVALSMLVETLQELGYDALLCDESNHKSDACVNLTGTSSSINTK